MFQVTRNMLPKSILQKFTENTKKTLENALEIAFQSKAAEVMTEHLLMSIYKTKGSLGMALLQLHNFKNKNVNKITTDPLPEPPKNKKHYLNISLSLEVKKILKKAALIASQCSHKYIGTEHILYSIIDSKNEKIDRLLERDGIDKKRFKKALENILNDTVIFPDPMSVFGITPSKIQEERRLQKNILSYFCINLTLLASQNKIEPIIGREPEIERLIHILNRKTKNNPILIGEPGVGKTAVVQGLALKIAKTQVPENLKNIQILSLDLGSVMAGTILRGDLEARLKEIIEETKQIKNVVLFIDEIHNIVGAGGANGAMDVANILKPALSQGEIQCIGATTIDEYRRFIEKDRALERRFQPLILKEINDGQAIKVIAGLKTTYEQFHNVKISDEAVKAAVALSSRYITDRYLPDKAIDVLDETASRLRSRTPKITSVQKQIETLKNQLKTIEIEKEKSVLNEDYQSALNLKQEQQKVITRLKELEPKKYPTEFIIVNENDIKQTIAAMTGIPVDEIKNIENIKRLEKKLKSQVVGQDHAIKTIISYIKRAQAGIASPSRPWGSFLFLGPSGVGKTELAKKIAWELFGSKESFIKLDMSEFMEKHNVSRLIGAPPGYIGYEEGGKLTEKIKRNPYSLILFDEIEKAHPDVFNILLQILEDGVLTDGRGTQVNFRNTVIIITSNIGTNEFGKQASKLGFAIGNQSNKKQDNLEKKYEEIKNKALKELEIHMRPELLGRIDQIVVFKPLEIKTIEKIVDLEIKNLKSRLKNIKLIVHPQAKKMIAKKSFSYQQGARLIRKQIQVLIEDPIAQAILDSNPREIEIKTKNGKFVLDKK